MVSFRGCARLAFHSRACERDRRVRISRACDQEGYVHVPVRPEARVAVHGRLLREAEGAHLEAR